MITDIDSKKQAIYLYYLARATKRQNGRELREDKRDLAVKQLKKIDTKKISKNLEQLEGHLEHVVKQEKYIIEHQDDEEKLHKRIKHKIGKLDGKLHRYVKTEIGRKKRIAELEHKITQKFKTKRDHLDSLKMDLKKLTAMYSRAHKSKKYNKAILAKIHERLIRIRTRLGLLK